MARVIAARYRLDEELAAGGFGTVWRAWDQLLQVAVAVKQTHLDPAASEAVRAKAVARAEAEARTAAKLRDHPNIVAVHDVAFDDGVPWLVMRLVRGRSLHAELAARGRLHPDEAGRIAIGVLEGLAAAHAAGVVHRDVKPANIMLADDGAVLLTDFGIAKHHDDGVGTTHGVVLGSLPYMSPERLDGETTPAGDMFALGASLYEMTEGVSPFARPTMTAIISAVARLDPVPPVHAGRLGAVILALLDKDAAKRPDARAALRMLNAGETEPTVAAVPVAARVAVPPAVTTPSTAARPAVPMATRTLRIKDASGLNQPLRIFVDGVKVGVVRPDLIEKVSVTSERHEIRVLTLDGSADSPVITTDPSDPRPLSFTVQRGSHDGRLLRLDHDPLTSEELLPPTLAAARIPADTAFRTIRPGRAVAIGLAVGVGVLAMAGVVMAVGIGILHGDVQDARTGGCVVQTKDARWQKESCIEFFQPDNMGSYKVLLRIDGTTDPDRCATEVSGWTPGDTAHVVVGTGTDPSFVLCLRPR